MPALPLARRKARFKEELFTLLLRRRAFLRASFTACFVAMPRERVLRFTERKAWQAF